MNSVNKILLLFLFVIATSLVGIWEFVQSEMFASKLSIAVTEYTKKYLDADLNFDRIEFKFFPPGIEINNVSLSKISKDEAIQTQVGSLGFEFNPFDLFKTDLTVEKVYFFDGVINVKAKGFGTKKKTNEPKDDINETLKQIKISESIRTLKSKLPFFINNIELEKINISLNENSLVTHFARLSLYESSINLLLTLRNFNLAKLNIKDEILDEVKLDVRFFDELVKVKTLEVSKGMNLVALSGVVNKYLDLENMNFDFKTNIEGHISDIHNYLDFESVGKLRKGYISIDASVVGKIEQYQVNTEIVLENFDTDFLTGDKATLKARIDEKRIVFKEFKLLANSGELKLDKSFEFFNFETGKFVEENIFVTANKIPARNALKYLEKNLSILQGDLSGKIEFILNPDDFSFKINEGLTIFDLKLVPGADSDPVLDIKEVKIDKGYFDIVRGNVFIGLDLVIGASELSVKGEIKNGTVAFKSKQAVLDLADLGKIAQFSIKGRSKLDLDVVANLREQKLSIKTTIENFSFEEYFQESLSTELVLNFKSSDLYLKKIRAKTGQTTTRGDFKLNLNNLTVNANVTQSKFSVRDLKKMYAPALKDLKLPEERMFGDWTISSNISGKLNLEDLVAEGQFVGYNNYAFGEGVDLVKLNYKLKDSVLNLDDIFLAKANGGIQAGLRLDIKQNDMIFWGNINKVPLVEINNYEKLPLALTGKISGLFKGRISNHSTQFQTELNVNNSKIYNKKVGDSYFKIKLDNELIDYSISMLGKQFSSKGQIDLTNKRKDNSYIKWAIDCPDLNQTLSALAFVDHLKTGLDASLDVSGEVNFNLQNFDKFSAKMNLTKLKIIKGLINVNYTNREDAQVIVNDGEIQKWDLNIRGSKFYLVSKGAGNLQSKYDISSRIKIDATLLEVFNVLISKASGSMIGNIHHFKNAKDEDYTAKLVSNNLAMSSDLMPLALSRGELLVSYKKRKILLKKLKGQLNSGNFLLNGIVDLSRIIPDVNIRYEFQNAGVPILKKSSITFSGKGSIVGKTVPYTLGGEIQIQKCSIVNEITDFAGGEKIIRSDIDYLPQDKSKSLNQFLNFNININTLEPIRITNSMANLGFTGNLLLSGGEKEPRLSGKIGLAPMQNQIFFKNNTFNLTKGNIFFYDRNKLSNPELDFQASSIINKYNINIAVLGQLQEFKLDLNAEPVLSQSDILSLVAFGYTEDLSTNLSDTEKESMTRAGVGSIIFDRFKINETLKNEFGLQVNLGTQISQEEGSYLSQRDAEGTDVGRVRSATTIEIKKQISEAIDLSVSSTVGGSVGQRQTMNLNYNLNKNLSLEGVYQSSTESQSAENQNNDSSLGADVKIRWSFR